MADVVKTSCSTPILIFVQINLSRVLIEAFEDYENQSLAMLSNHGGILIERLRTKAGANEYHLLQFPSQAALEGFLTDPARTTLRDLWQGCGASSSFEEVTRLQRT